MLDDLSREEGFDPPKSKEPKLEVDEELTGTTTDPVGIVQDGDQRWRITKAGSLIWGYTGGALASGIGSASSWAWDSTLGRFVNKKPIDSDKKMESDNETSSESLAPAPVSSSDVEKLSDDLSKLSVYQTDSTESVQSSRLSWIPFLGGSQPTLDDLVRALTDALDNLNAGGGRIIGRFESGIKALISDTSKGRFDRILNIDITLEAQEGQVPLTTGVLELALNRDRHDLAVATMNRLRTVLTSRSVNVVESGDESESSVSIDQTFDEGTYYQFIDAINNTNLTGVWRYIIEQNGNINYRPSQGGTALEVALGKYLSLETNDENKEEKENLLNIIKLLLLQGAQPSTYTILNSRNIDALRPYLEYQRVNYFAAWQGVEETTPTINEDGLAIILEAAENGDSGLLRYTIPLLSKNDINYQATNGRTALSLAADRGHLEATNILLDAEGVNVNLAENNGLTPIAYAVINNHLPIVQRLLQIEGIDVNATDRDNNTLLHHIVLRGHQLQEELINSSNRKERNRISRAIEDNEKILEMLLRAPGITVDEVNRENHTPLSLAAEFGLGNLALRLMHYGTADIDVTVEDQTIVERTNNAIDALSERIKESNDKGDKNKLIAERARLANILKQIETIRENRSLEKEMAKVSINPLDLVRKGKGKDKKDPSLEDSSTNDFSEDGDDGKLEELD